MRQRMMDGIKTSLGVTDEEWKAMQPLVEKVQTLSRQVQGAGMMGMMRRNRGGAPGAPAGGEAPAPTTDLEKKTQDAQKVADNKDAKPEEIKAALTALRDERAKANEELKTAKDELRKTLTLGQELKFVLMGMLD